MPATPAELDAILHGAAIAPISAPGYELFARSFLRITGPDATRWLNGMVTNSVQALAPGEGNYNFLLNAQGRIQADCTLYRELGEGEPSFLVATDSSQLEALQNTLDRYIIMDDVELVPARPDEESLLILGPGAPEALSELGLPAPSANRLTIAEISRGRIAILTPAVGSCFELRADPDQLAPLRERLSLPAVSPAALEAFRILSGTPRYGQDIRNSDTARDLPQETNQTHALHFAKGCYLGQEIVERIRSRGQVHRLFTRFRLEGDLPATFPTSLHVDGKPAGELTSAALVPLPEGPQLLALGYARREFLELRKDLTYSAGTAIPLRASDNPATNN